MRSKISVSFDEKNYFWIVVDNGRLIKNPTKEDLYGTKLKSYNKTNICPRCREESDRYGIELTVKSILYFRNVVRRGTGEWVCKRHYYQKITSTKYRIYISKDDKNYFWIVWDNGKLIMNPTEDDLKYTEVKYYNKTNICSRCREYNEKYGRELTDKSILCPGNVHKEKDKDGNKTGKWICHRHEGIDYQKYDPNSPNNTIKSIRDCRTGNQDPNSTQVLGDNSQELACELYGWIDLNKKNDNYSTGTPIDCYDPKTGLYHQVQGRRYSVEYGTWPNFNFERELKKIFEDMVCICISEDGKTVERIYVIPLKEIKRIKGISIYKNQLKKNSGTLYQYEQYRRTDKDEIKKANIIWNKTVGDKQHE